MVEHMALPNKGNMFVIVKPSTAFIKSLSSIVYWIMCFFELANLKSRVSPHAKTTQRDLAPAYD